jgi:hypothetical protein
MSQKNELLNDQKKPSLGVTSEMAIQCMRGVLAARITRTDEIRGIRSGSEGLSRGSRLLIQVPRKALGTGRVINEATRTGLLAHPEGLGDPPVDPPKTK